MTSVQRLLETAVESGTVPGAAALVARGDDVEIGAAGELTAKGSAGSGHV